MGCDTPQKKAASEIANNTVTNLERQHISGRARRFTSQIIYQVESMH